MFRTLLLTAAMLWMLSASQSDGAEASARRKVGDVYAITRIRDSATQGSDGSSGSSHDVDSLVERVIAVRPDGLELEYDLPNAASADERAGNWEFPVRVFEPARGPLQLLNGPELEARVDPWLRAAGMSRAACGHLIFTWNAFRIECDPQSVIATIEAYRLRPSDLRDGDPYQDDDALGSGTLARAAGPTGMTFTVVLDVDPDAVRQARARSDVAVAEIMRKPTTLDAALRERAKDIISGTISITFSTDSAGNILRRTRVAKLETKAPNGKTERQTTTETVERRLVSGRSLHR